MKKRGKVKKVVSSYTFLYICQVVHIVCCFDFFAKTDYNQAFKVRQDILLTNIKDENYKI